MLAIVVYAGLSWMAGGIASPWFRSVGLVQPSFAKLAQTSGGLSRSLLSPAWSITAEWMASILIPLFAIVARKGIVPWSLPQAAFRAAAVMASHLRLYPYLWAFVLSSGITLVGKDHSRFPATAIAVLGIMSLLLLWFFWLLSPEWSFETIVPLLVESLVAARLFIAIVVRPGLFSILRTPVLVSLGDWSYSLYLVHWPVMGAVFARVATLIPDLAASHPAPVTMLGMAIILIVTVGFARLSYRYVELPGIAAGRRVWDAFQQNGGWTRSIVR